MWKPEALVIGTTRFFVHAQRSTWLASFWQKHMDNPFLIHGYLIKVLAGFWHKPFGTHGSQMVGDGEGMPGKRGLWTWLVVATRCFLSTATSLDAEDVSGWCLQIYLGSTLQFKRPAPLPSPLPLLQETKESKEEPHAWSAGFPHRVSNFFLIPTSHPQPQPDYSLQKTVTQSYQDEDLGAQRPFPAYNGLDSLHQASLGPLVLWGNRVFSLPTVPLGTSSLCPFQV